MSSRIGMHPLNSSKFVLQKFEHLGILMINNMKSQFVQTLGI